MATAKKAAPAAKKAGVADQAAPTYTKDQAVSLVTDFLERKV